MHLNPSTFSCLESISKKTSLQTHRSRMACLVSRGGWIRCWSFIILEYCIFSVNSLLQIILFCQFSITEDSFSVNSVSKGILFSQLNITNYIFSHLSITNDYFHSTQYHREFSSFNSASQTILFSQFNITNDHFMWIILFSQLSITKDYFQSSYYHCIDRCTQFIIERKFSLHII